MDETNTRIKSRRRETGAESREPGVSRDDVLVPRRATLDGFAQEVALSGGVEISGLDALTRMSVHTENTLYNIIVLGPQDPKVIMRGGRFFSDPTIVCLSGSSFGGNFLKMGWIGYGMRMEVYHDGRSIVTSPVRTIEIVDDSHLPGPF